MSLFGAMRTSVSGMSAQSNRISSVADNIANSATTGYKRSSIEFATMLGNTTPMGYSSGGALSRIRYGVSEQGSLQQSSSITDLAVQGGGFFVVRDSNGALKLTRAGAFAPDANGNLVNAAGYTLMGQDMRGVAGGAATGPSSLTRVNINQAAMIATPSTAGRIQANLSSQAAVVAAAQLPSANAAGATYTAKTSLVAYDNLGAPITLDVYFTKTGPNTWEAAVFDRAAAAPGGGFPYSAGPMTTGALAFSPTTGALTSGGNLSIAIPNGNTIKVDMTSMTQLAAAYSVADQSVDGSAPSRVDHIEIGRDGLLSAVYQNGARVTSHRIPLATCASPDRLAVQDGNVFAESLGSGDIIIGNPLEGRLGAIISGALESSTVDLASEMTTMIEAQRGYSANTKVFQAGSDLVDVLMNLKV